MTTCSGDTCGTGGWAGPLPGDPDNNVVLTATTAWGGIELSWTMPGINPQAVAYVEIYRGINADFNQALLVARAGGDNYFDKRNTSQLYYYWIKLVSKNTGFAGDPIGPASAMAQPLVSQIIEELTGQIDDSALALALKEKIDSITTLGADLSNETAARAAALQALQELLEATQGDLDTYKTLVANEVAQRQAADGALVDQVNLVAVAGSNNAAAILNEQTARVSADSALATDMTQLEARVNDDIAQVQLDVQAAVDDVGVAKTLYTVRLNSNGLAGGFGVWNDGTTVAAGFDVDSFWIGKTGPDKVKPFIVQDGVVYMNNAMISQLTADKIDTKGLTIKDASGNVILGAGLGLDWSKIGGGLANLRAAGYTGSMQGSVAGGYVNSDPMLQNKDEWQLQVNSGASPVYYPNFSPGSDGLQNAWDKQDGLSADIYSAPFPVSPNLSYEISTALYAFGATASQFYLGVQFLDANGDTIVANTSGSTGWGALGTYHYFGRTGQTIPVGGSFYTIKIGPLGTASIPANAVKAKLLVLGNYAQLAVGRWAWGGGRVRELVDGKTLNISASNIGVYMQAAAIDSLYINNLRTSNYAEDGSGYPTAGAKLSSQAGQEALKVAAGSFRLGSVLFTDYWFRLVNGIDGSLAGGAVLWRGNNDASTRSGTPNINCLSVYTWESQVVSSNFQQTYHRFKLTPTSYNTYSDNLDAMTQIHVQYFQTASSTAPFTECYVACPSRSYNGGTGEAWGSWHWGWRYQQTGGGATPGSPGVQLESNNQYSGYLRIRLGNTYGWSATKDFAPSTVRGGLLSSTTITGVAGSSSAGGGAMGGFCPAPWVKVRLLNGKEVEAGSLYNGARLAAVNDETLEPIAEGGVVDQLTVMWKQRFRVKLANGQATEWSEKHRFAVAEKGWVEVQNLRPGDHIIGMDEAIVESVLAMGEGQVVSFIVKGAGTYFGGGLLCHNLKSQMP